MTGRAGLMWGNRQKQEVESQQQQQQQQPSIRPSSITSAGLRQTGANPS